MAKTAYPTSSTRRAELRRSGFTLTEVLVAASLSGMLMIAVLSAFLMLGRTGANIRNYTEVESKARSALEVFSRETRLAYAVTAASTTSVTLSVPDTSPTRDAPLYSVTYSLDTAQKRFTRNGPPLGEPTGTVATTVLIEQVEAIGSTNPFNYYRYVNSSSAGYVDGFTTNTAGSLAEVKQIEINFVLKRRDVTVTEATNKVLSARFILRNK